MLPNHVALVSEDSNIKTSELSTIAAALQKQVTRDFGPLWGIHADVSAYARLEDVPLDYWPIVVKDDIGDPSAAGYHEDKHGQPFALVKYDANWSLTASHEALEMLADPFGRRMVSGGSPMKGQGNVQFLVEVCDPCEAEEFSYGVNGVVVSDFYTPHFFDPVAAPGVRYSFRNSIKKPRDVLKGGYLSWYDPGSKKWWQRTWFSGTNADDNELSGMKIANGNVRAAIDRLTESKRAKAMGRPTGKRARFEMATPVMDASEFKNRAAALREAIKQIDGK
jgi:hypothetical protein